MILGRNNVPLQSTTRVNEVKKGAYILKEENKRLDCIIIATGEEVNLALEVSTKLSEKGIDTRVISMPSIERFEAMDLEYKNEVLPKIDNTFVIEASSSYSWDRYVTDREHLFTIDIFGSSGACNDVLDKYNFTEKYIEEKIEELIK